MSEIDDKKVMTPEFRAAFAHVFEPQQAFEPGGDEKYGITMLFKKGEDLSKLKAAAKAVMVEKFGPDKSDWPQIRLPFRDQGDKVRKDRETGKVIKDENGNPELQDGHVAGAVFVNATSKIKPGLVDQKVEDITDRTEFYSGCYARATIRAFHYKVKGNEGIGFGLQNVQKLRDGDPLGGGRTKPEDDFSPTEGDPISDDDDLPASAPSGGGTAADMLD